MFGGKATKPQSRIDSLIGEGTVVEGNVIFNGGLRIDGRVKGNVLTAGFCERALDDVVLAIPLGEERDAAFAPFQIAAQPGPERADLRRRQQAQVRPVALRFLEIVL